MEIAELVLEYVKVLAWPLVVGLALYWFRAELKTLLGRVRSAKGFGVEVDMAEQITEQISATLNDESKPADERVLAARGSAEELLELLQALEREQEERQFRNKWAWRSST